MKLALGRFLETSKLLQTKSGQELADLITVVADFMNQVTLALQGKLTVTDNLDGAFKSVSLTHNTAQVLNTGSRVPVGITVARVISDTYGVQCLKWFVDGQNRVQVKVTYDATPTRALDVILEIKYG